MNNIEYRLEKKHIEPRLAQTFRGAICNKLHSLGVGPIDETDTHIIWVLPQDEGERVKAILAINTDNYNLEENTLA